MKPLVRSSVFRSYFVSCGKTFRRELRDLGDTFSFAPDWAIWAALLVGVFCARLPRPRWPAGPRASCVWTTPALPQSRPGGDKKSDTVCVIADRACDRLASRVTRLRWQINFRALPDAGHNLLDRLDQPEGAPSRCQPLSAQFPYRRHARSIGAQTRNSGPRSHARPRHHNRARDLGLCADDVRYGAPIRHQCFCLCGRSRRGFRSCRPAGFGQPHRRDSAGDDSANSPRRRGHRSERVRLDRGDHRDLCRHPSVGSTATDRAAQLFHSTAVL